MSDFKSTMEIQQWLTAKAGRRVRSIINGEEVGYDVNGTLWSFSYNRLSYVRFHIYTQWQKVIPPKPWYEREDANGAPCWFWVDDEENKILGTFAGFVKEYEYQYRMINTTSWRNARPLTPDEIREHLLTKAEALYAEGVE